MSAPSTTIRELIFQDIKSAIQAIDGNPDYFYSVKAECVNIIHGGKTQQYLREPYIYIYPGIEVSILGKEERGKIYKTLSIGIEAWIRSDETLTDMGLKINQILHDLEKAIMIDPFRNNQAIDTRFVSSETFMESLDSPKCGVLLNIEVDYESDFNNPSSLMI